MTNKNYLTNEKYTEMGDSLANVVTDLRLIKHTTGFITSPKDLKNGDDALSEYLKLHNYLEELSNKLRHFENDLDDISTILFHVNNLKELKNLVSKEYLNDPTTKSSK